MAVTNYHTVNGEIVGETTSGVRTDYLVDALGSVTGTVNQSAQVLNTYRYKPYGALLAKTGTAADPKSQWVGTLGYRATSRAQSDYYIRARHYGSAPGRWTTMDRLWPILPAYQYAESSPAVSVDVWGLQAQRGAGNTNDGWDEWVPPINPIDALYNLQQCDDQANVCLNACNLGCEEQTSHESGTAEAAVAAVVGALACGALTKNVQLIQSCAGAGWTIGQQLGQSQARQHEMNCKRVCANIYSDDLIQCEIEYKQQKNGYYRSCWEVAYHNCQSQLSAFLHSYFQPKHYPGLGEPFPPNSGQPGLWPPSNSPRPQEPPSNPGKDYDDCLAREYQSCVKRRKKSHLPY
jgi:RHS repeat-associated protein